MNLPLQRVKTSAGSLGFLDLQSLDGQWNILIRTLEAQGQEDGSWRAVVKAGGGLTIGSDPACEVEEAKLKVRKRLWSVAMKVDISRSYTERRLGHLGDVISPG